MKKSQARRPDGWPTALGLAVALAVSSCAMGPNFREPEPPAIADASHPYSEVPLPAATASAPGPTGLAQSFATGQDIPAEWWQVFHSDALDQLIREALAHSPTLASAQAALRAAQENAAAQLGSTRFPSVSAQLGAERQRAASSLQGVPAGTTFNVFTASLDVAYTVDVFGANQRELEALRAAVDYQQYQVEAAYVTLTANVVVAAVQEASLRAQLQATHEVVDAEHKSLDVIRRQVELGAAARGAILQQQTLVAQAEATIPALEKALWTTRHQLAALAGRLPGDGGLPTFDLAALQLPQTLPVTVPSQLVRQRPDIRASEALLHQASAQVGVAAAALYPQFSLSGSVDRESLKFDKLFSGATTGWTLVGGILQPIFNGGALRAKERAAYAAFDQAQWQYRLTVLVAFQNVADALRAVESDARALATQADAERLARESLDLVTRQYRLGAVSYLASLDAQRTWLQTRVALAQAQAARFSDTAALIEALGGGWWNAGEIPDISRVAQAGAAATAASAP
jgi:NodT family efflux transporter outer membrane factor (OMF) lipoprotein